MTLFLCLCLSLCVTVPICWSVCLCVCLLSELPFVLLCVCVCLSVYHVSVCLLHESCVYLCVCVPNKGLQSAFIEQHRKDHMGKEQSTSQSKKFHRVLEVIKSPASADPDNKRCCKHYL